MKLLIVVILLFTTLQSKEYLKETFSQKLIVSSNKEKAVIEKELLKLKIYFMDTSETKALQSKYHFTCKIETLGSYYLLVISPIQSIELKNRLVILLSSFYPKLFAIDELLQKPIKHTIPKRVVHRENIDSSLKLDKGFFETIELQWLAIWILALVGLFASLMSRKKILQHGMIQKKLSKYQDKIERGIKQLGEKNV